MKHANRKAHEIHWRSPEFIYRDKSFLWYAHITIFFFLIVLLFLFLKYYFVIPIVGLLFWYFLSQANEKPRTIDYKIDTSGIRAGPRDLTYAEIHSFTIDVVQHTPVIMCELNYPFSMPLTLVVKKEELEEIIMLLSTYIPLRNEFSFIRWLTHRLHY